MELVVGHLQCGVLTLQMFAAVNSARREGIAASQTGHYGHCRCPRYLPPMPSVLSNTFLSAIQKMKRKDFLDDIIREYAHWLKKN